jgi:hypothetical protein
VGSPDPRYVEAEALEGAARRAEPPDEIDALFTAASAETG